MLRISILLLFLTYSYAQKSAGVYVVDPTGAYAVTGTIVFTKSDAGIDISGTVQGLSPGNHGFHIHELGNIAGGCANSGAHFNPHNLTHGAPEDSIRHVGDLGNIVADPNGQATINITDSVISLEGDHNIIGRAVVVHAAEDDLGKGGNADSLATGNAGARVACGVIGLLSKATPTIPVSLGMLIITLLVSMKNYFN